MGKSEISWGGFCLLVFPDSVSTFIVPFPAKTQVLQGQPVLPDFYFVPPHDSWKVLCHWWLNKVLTSGCILNPHIPKGHISRCALTKPRAGSYKGTVKNIFVKEHSGALHSKRAQENPEASCITEIASINLLPSSIK